MAKIPINIVTGSFKEEELILGIDLGTTNSLIAFIEKESGLPRCIADASGHMLVPSVIHFDENGPAEIGTSALPFLISDPENTLYSIKRLMGKSEADLENYSRMFGYKLLQGSGTDDLVKVQVQGKAWSPIELSGLILNELKEKAAHFLRTTVRKVVITVPAYFNDSQRQATRDAGKWAGLDVLRVINEPTAASLAYGIGVNNTEKEIIAVYDLGGGTFDVSILQLEDGVFEVLSTHGDTFLGGDDFDRAIVLHWQLLLGEAQLEKTDFARLRVAAETAKKGLSESEFWTGTCLIHEKEVPLSLSKVEFELLIHELISQTMDSCKKALMDAGLDASDIGQVVLVGGSSRVPAVREKVCSFFAQAQVHDHMNPDQVVALGAAIQADILAGNRKDLLLLDVTPLSLGIETMGGLIDVIIPRNSKIPTRVGRQYTTSNDGQSSLRISVYQGERDLVADCRKIGTFDLTGIPGMPAGLPKVEVAFSINADGILKVTASELRSGITQEITMTPAYGLDDAAVEKMLIESMEHAGQDIEMRSLLEAKNEAQILLDTSHRFIKKNAAYLSEEEIELTQTSMDALQKAIELGVKQEISTLTEELNETTRPFAERVMDLAIAKAMKGAKI